MFYTFPSFNQTQLLGTMPSLVDLPTLPFYRVPAFRPLRQSLPISCPVVTSTTTTTATSTGTVVFNQTVPSATWTINHNLGQFPSVTVVDTSGNVVLPDVRYVSNMQIVITFALPFAGSAYLNV